MLYYVFAAYNSIMHHLCVLRQSGKNIGNSTPHVALGAINQSTAFSSHYTRSHINYTILAHMRFILIQNNSIPSCVCNVLKYIKLRFASYPLFYNKLHMRMQQTKKKNLQTIVYMRVVIQYLTPSKRSIDESSFVSYKHVPFN